MKLAGKIALITGGSRGIGRATALAFAAEGADIAFGHLNDAPVGRFGRPEEIAATALLLAGPDGGFYVGATLSRNGGDVMY